MRILVVDDQRSIRLAVTQAIRAEGHQADSAETGTVAMLKLDQERYDLVLLDLRLESESDGLDYLARLQKSAPGLPVVICTAHGSIATAVDAMRRGAYDVLEKPLSPSQLRQILERAEKARDLVHATQLALPVVGAGPDADFSSDDPVMQNVLSVVNRAAGTRATILLLGENGTGKTSLAKYIHQHSHFASGPFVTVSCPSLSRELLESELFGHVKGAFTGALQDTWGKVEAARGGTVFLDEIGELSVDLQPKLLRLLQEKSYERVGETQTRFAEVRVVAATSCDLGGAVKAGTFRADLFYRLNVISVTVPPLRERLRDLERHAGNFLEFFAAESGRTVHDFTPGAWEALRRHSWPGNLRELRNTVERAVILACHDQVGASDLPEDFAAVEAESHDLALGSLVPLRLIEQTHVLLVMARTPTLEEAARVLGVDVATVYRKRKRWAAMPTGS